jgi:hypothetical protein
MAQDCGVARKERREILNRMKEENDNRMKLIANLEVKLHHTYFTRLSKFFN